MENVFVPAHLTDVEVVYQLRRGSKVPGIWGPLASANWRYVVDREVGPFVNR